MLSNSYFIKDCILNFFSIKFHVRLAVLSTLRKWEAVRMEMAYTMFVYIRDGPDNSFVGYPAILKPDTKFPARYPVDARYRISGWILDISMPLRCSTELLK